MKVKKHTIELLKKGNVAYPKATLLNVYDAIIYLASEIDKLKENDLKVIEAVKDINGILTAKDPGDSTAFAIENISKSKRWGIGSKFKTGKSSLSDTIHDGWGIHHGPFMTEKECLEISGSNGDYILLLTGESQIIKYYWKEVGWVNYNIEETKT